ncbi:hypothetical protein RRG08_026228 [Elysia crispata]|uniref:Uncharacterized protein n=1 Tax=Elysia crispata TaxID=231223 RepID=A0AAE0ZAD9_9GAST|nr:hypothetical protein RRG08_026228 [Elysia crispata]
MLRLLPAVIKLARGVKQQPSLQCPTQPSSTLSPLPCEADVWTIYQVAPGLSPCSNSKLFDPQVCTHNPQNGSAKLVSTCGALRHKDSHLVVVFWVTNAYDALVLLISIKYY